MYERGGMRRVAEQHADQAMAFMAQAELGEANYELGDAKLTDLTRDQQLQAAQTHALLACYFELRYQSETAFPGRG